MVVNVLVSELFAFSMNSSSTSTNYNLKKSNGVLPSLLWVILTVSVKFRNIDSFTVFIIITITTTASASITTTTTSTGKLRLQYGFKREYVLFKNGVHTGVFLIGWPWYSTVCHVATLLTYGSTYNSHGRCPYF